MNKRTEALFAAAVKANPRWAGLPLQRLGNSRIVLPHPDSWIPAHCKVCDRELGAIGNPSTKMLVPPGEERSGETGPQYRCSNRDECTRYAEQRRAS